VPHTFAFFANAWVLRAPLHSGIGIRFLKWLEYRAPRGVSVISTHCGRVETHTSQSARCVGHPAVIPAWLVVVHKLADKSVGPKYVSPPTAPASCAKGAQEAGHPGLSGLPVRPQITLRCE
jgi:hypothetical protein